MLRYNIHLRFIARLYGLVHHAEGFFREAGPLLEWHLKIMRQITRQQREKRETERQEGGRKKKKKHHLYLESERTWRTSRSGVRAEAGRVFLMVCWVDYSLSFWIFQNAWFVWLKARTHTHTHTHTHISPTSDPRKLWVGVGFQMATQSHHCAPVNTMKTKLTHRWHSTPPPPHTLPNLDFQHNSGGTQKQTIGRYRNLRGTVKIQDTKKLNKCDGFSLFGISKKKKNLQMLLEQGNVNVSFHFL